MTKPKTPAPQNEDRQTYQSVAIVFFVIGVTMLITEATRPIGLPFFILGITFFILSRDKTTNS